LRDEQTSGDDAGDLLQELVNRVSHRGRGEVLALMAEASVTLHQVMALSVLAQKGESTLLELATALNMSQSAMSQMVDRLFQLEYVERAEHPTDRRKKRLALTPKAGEFLKRLSEARSAEYRDGIAWVSPALREELADVLRRVLQELRTS
jgi:DNA-binding MarR family transcriptional regulator